MGEDAFLLAAQGYEVTLYEQNPVIAALLKDAIRRAKKNMDLKDIAGRMKVIEGNSVEGMSKLLDPVDVIYLDPMFSGKTEIQPDQQETSIDPEAGTTVFRGKGSFLMQLSEQIRIRSSSSVR